MVSESEQSTRQRAGDAAKVGVGFGSVLAITISWSINQSIGWAIVHGILSWIYVIYYAMMPTRPWCASAHAQETI